MTKPSKSLQLLSERFDLEEPELMFRKISVPSKMTWSSPENRVKAIIKGDTILPHSGMGKLYRQGNGSSII